ALSLSCSTMAGSSDMICFCPTFDISHGPAGPLAVATGSALFSFSVGLRTIADVLIFGSPSNFDPKQPTYQKYQSILGEFVTLKLVLRNFLSMTDPAFIVLI